MENNPLKNAELSVEQNYDHIDGLINNLLLPPRHTRSREREER